MPAAKNKKKEKNPSLQTEEVETESLNPENVILPREKYFETVGRRKTAIARIRLFTRKTIDKAEENNTLLTINQKDYRIYFPLRLWQETVESPLHKLKVVNRFKVIVRVKGGGLNGQAEAVRHGLARALVLFDSNFAKKLRKAGFLTRDPREKERRKYGHKKARKSPQWSKR